MKINEIEVGYIYSDNKEGLRKARAASAETKISALMSKISTLVDKRLSFEPCAEAEEDLLQFLRTRYAAPAHPAEGVPAQAVQPSDALIDAVDSWFADNTGLGGCSDKDVAELAAIFATQPAAQGMDAETQRHAAIGKVIERASRA